MRKRFGSSMTAAVAAGVGVRGARIGGDAGELADERGTGRHRDGGLERPRA